MYVPSSHSSASVHGHREGGMTSSTSHQSFHSAIHQRKYKPAELAGRRPPPKPPGAHEGKEKERVMAQAEHGSGDERGSAADERKKQIERLKAYWGDKACVSFCLSRVH